jgi:ABC-type phosphate/phosphonate transport system permease subunit
MEEKKVSTLFEDMRDDVSHYISSSFELGKLEVFEKVSLGAAVTGYALIVAGITLISLFFILLTTALYLGDLFQNLWIGFGVVTALAVAVLLITLLLKKTFKHKIANEVVRFLMTRDDKDDKKSNK